MKRHALDVEPLTALFGFCGPVSFTDGSQVGEQWPGARERLSLVAGGEQTVGFHLVAGTKARLLSRGNVLDEKESVLSLEQSIAAWRVSNS